MRAAISLGLIGASLLALPLSMGTGSPAFASQDNQPPVQLAQYYPPPQQQRPYYPPPPQQQQYGPPPSRGGFPGWLAGNYVGFNRQGLQLGLSIAPDGRSLAFVNGQKVPAYVRGGNLYVNGAQFYLQPTPDGFNATQAGNPRNRIHYQRR